ncbi:MAG TPA: clostripain-related cysteine peptidase [Spirochaetia bacterium]|nr:clostripain-related cysteine peptidase [Spirochaetia bacterium]
MLALSALAGCRLGTAIGPDQSIRDPSTFRERASWTLLVYMCADNELEGYALADINEMETAMPRMIGVNVVVLCDRAPGYDTSNGDWTCTRLYEVTADPEIGSALIASKRVGSVQLGLSAAGDEELDLGDPAVLGGFVAFGKEAYPADHYALIIWGHGTGWRGAQAELDSALERAAVRAPAGSRAAGLDESDGEDLLFTYEIGRALAGQGLEVIGFDTCSAAMLELAYQLRSAGTYMVGSEDIVQADGFRYGDLLERFSHSPQDADGLVDAIIASYADAQCDASGSTISAVRLSSIGAVMSALNALSDALWSATTTAAMQSALRRAIFEDVEAFYATPGDLNVDLADLADVVSERFGVAGMEAAALRSSVLDAVSAEWHHPSGHPRAHGLAVHYVPLASDGTAISHDAAYFRGAPVANSLSFVQDSTWVPCYPGGPGLLYRLWYERFDP